MLIIFDLDDTLVDTSICITPRKLEEALQAMIREGLTVDNFDSALRSLLEFDAAPGASSPSALEAFLSQHGYSKIFLPVGLAKLREELSPDHEPALAVPHAFEMLHAVKNRHNLAIVTMGSPSLQYSKLKKAGIDPAFFSKIVIIEEKNKKPSYQAIIEEARLPSQEVVVCGDRVAVDLVPAKELCCHTVHMARGRGRALRESALSSGIADYAIEDWQDFPTLIERINTLGHS